MLKHASGYLGLVPLLAVVNINGYQHSFTFWMDVYFKF